MVKTLLFIITLFLSVLSFNCVAQTPYTPGTYLYVTKTSAFSKSLKINIDTTAQKAYIRRLIDSALAAGGTSVDTAKFVSMNRDDAIKGEKTFLGVTRFGVGFWTYIAGEKRSWYISSDTCTTRIGDTLITVASTGTNQDIFQIYSSGILDLKKNSSVRAYRGSSNQTFLSSGSYVVFNAESWDIQKEFDIAAGEYVARVAGIYLVSVSIYVNTSSTPNILDCFIRKNGNNYAFSETATFTDGINYYATCQITSSVQLAAGDKISIYISSNNSNGVVVSGADASYISIMKTN